MFDGYIRLSVTPWGKISAYPDKVASTPSPPEKINTDNDLSAVEYELVSVEN
jgi:replication factor A1